MWVIFLRCLRASAAKHGGSRPITVNYLIALIVLAATIRAKEGMTTEELENELNEIIKNEKKG